MYILEGIFTTIKIAQSESVTSAPFFENITILMKKYKCKGLNYYIMWHSEK